MKRAAIYARVSTNSGQNPEMQLEEIRQYCAKAGGEIAEEYVDIGISGVMEHGPALDRLLKSCRKRLVDAVAVYRYGVLPAAFAILSMLSMSSAKNPSASSSVSTCQP